MFGLPLGYLAIHSREELKRNLFLLYFLYSTSTTVYHLVDSTRRTQGCLPFRFVRVPWRSWFTAILNLQR